MDSIVMNIIPKELYIDNFNFVPQNSEDEAEKFICDAYNNTIEVQFLLGRTSINFVHKRDGFDFITYYDKLTKEFNLQYLSQHFYEEYNYDRDKIDEQLKPIITHHFKCEVDKTYYQLKYYYSS